MADKLIRKLRKVGDSHALVIDATTMEQLRISSDTSLQLTVREGSLLVSPVLSGAGPHKVKDALTRIRQQPGYPDMLFAPVFFGLAQGSGKTARFRLDAEICRLHAWIFGLRGPNSLALSRFPLV
jgi:antitoxin component of MazEF toxin-antitoxin module